MSQGIAPVELVILFPVPGRYAMLVYSDGKNTCKLEIQASGLFWINRRETEV